MAFTIDYGPPGFIGILLIGGLIVIGGVLLFFALTVARQARDEIKEADEDAPGNHSDFEG